MRYVFMHGLGQNPLSWEKVVYCLPEEMQTVCPDLFSFVKNKGQEMTYENLYNAFKYYCNGIDVPLNLCGLSLGAVLSLNYAIEFPEKVKSLVLISPQYKTPQLLLKYQTFVSGLMPESAFRNTGLNKESMLLLLKSMSDLDLSDKLKKVKCPTLIICGQNDRANHNAANYLAAHLQNAKKEFIKNAGHEVNVDNPQKLAECMQDFYKSIS